jgi:predicted RNase H-like HicB family nuclease
MKTFSAVIEQDSAMGLYVGFVPGFPGARSQGGTLAELQHNLQEVIAMLLEDPSGIDGAVSIRIQSSRVRRPSD